MTLPTPPRKKWFLDRIGTRVWPTLGCSCESCVFHFQYGYFINEEEAALNLYDDELIIDKLTYFETKEQRDEHARRNILHS